MPTYFIVFFIDFFYQWLLYCTIGIFFCILVFLCILCLPMILRLHSPLFFLTEDVFFSYSSLIAVPIASLSAVKLIFTGALVNIPVIAGLSIPVHPLKSTSVKLVHPLNILAVLVRFGIFASVMDTLSSLLCPFSIPSMLVTPLNPLQPFSSVIWSFLPNTLQPLERPDKSCTVLFKFNCLWKHLLWNRFGYHTMEPQFLVCIC